MSDEAISMAEVATAEPVMEDQVTAPAQEPELESPKPDRVQMRMKTLTSKYKHSNDKVARLEKENEDLRGRIPKEPDFVVPGAPSEDLRFDDPDAFTRQTSAREEGLLKQGGINEARKAEESRVSAQQNEVRETARLADQKLANGYIDRALEAGFTEQRLEQNGQILAQSGISPEVAKAIYFSESGPQIGEYLADNPDMLDELNNASFLDVGTVFSKIKSNALLQKPLNTQAPDPISPTQGVGVANVGEWDSIGNGVTIL